MNMAAAATLSSTKRHNHDEYTDYSCSTSIERLARDVETVLRTWHVTDGSDRHVSMSSSSTAAAAATAKTIRANATTTATAPLLQQQQHKHQRQQQTQIHLIRSDQLSWTLAFHLSTGQRLHSEIDLELALWDAPCNRTSSFPSSATTTSNTTASSKKTASQQDLQGMVVDEDELPFSLQRPESLEEMPVDLFNNFSDLFGIGQHISLTPVNPEKLLQSNENGSNTNFNNANHNVSVFQHLAASVLQRHGVHDEESRTAETVLASILSGWLQTALDIAVSASHCCVPALGVWGRYQPHRASNNNNTVGQELCPPWLLPLSRLCLPEQKPRSFARRRGGRKDIERKKNRHFSPPIMLGRVIGEDCFASFSCSIAPVSSASAFPQLTSATTEHSSPDQKHELSLAVLAEMLLKHLPVNSTVVLWGARHVFSWYKPEKPKRMTIFFDVGRWKAQQVAWRRGGRRLPDEEEEESDDDDDDDDDDHNNSFHSVRNNDVSKMVIDLIEDDNDSDDEDRRECEAYALSLLEKAAGTSMEEPLWGPPEDPVAAVHGTLAWNGKKDDNDLVQPLLQFPLKVRSTLPNDMTNKDWKEMEDSVEKNLLDPFLNPCSSFAVQVQYDADIPQTSLTASQRCILAALIRTATLPHETLFTHLLDEALISRWNSPAGNEIAEGLAKRAGASPSTIALVAAMDWKHAVEDMIESEHAANIVETVLDPELTRGFPISYDNSNSTDETSNNSATKPMHKSAPPGRLLSMLFVHMGAVRTPSSMALVWTTFCHELRRKLDCRESLPNMRRVPALDAAVTDDKHTKHCYSTIGIKATNASQIYNSEPDPDDYHCLIGQKLQVFNVCMENAVAVETRNSGKLEKPLPKGGSQDDTVSSRPPSDPVVRPLTTGISHAPTHKGDHDVLDAIISEEKMKTFPKLDLTAAVDKGLERKGARCPVFGVSLVASGDQVYAPYLQRPFPLTDDVIAERRLLLSSSSASVLQRVEIAHRLQRPKLLSDMRAFKAANPGSVFQDFISWYGNPGNPLEEYGSIFEDLSYDNSGKPLEDELKSSNEQLRLHGEAAVATSDPVAHKLDPAAEAISVLNETRNFWAETWDKADPCPSVEQKPLFDASGTMEVVIDYLETLHPASLMCQVMAVNLASAYWALTVSAAQAKVNKVAGGVVNASLKRLRERVQIALQLLSTDVTRSTGAVHMNAQDDREDSSLSEGMMLFSVASIETIVACERACVALGESEIVVARATSLLDKLPNQHELVESILQQGAGALIEVIDRTSQRNTLDAILRYNHQQISNSQEIGQKPRPSVREYLFRNLDDSNPFQLTARYGEKEDADTKKAKPGRLLLALTKTTRD